MNELEDRLAERLRGLAEFARVEPGAWSPGMTITELAPVRNRRRTRVRVAAFGVAASLIVVAAVTLSLTVWSASPTDRVRTAPAPLDGPVSGEPNGPAVHQLTIQISNFRFQADRFDVPPGITELHLVSLEGSHTLAFDRPELSYVALAAPEGRTSVKVDFIAGQTYAIFDTLPGHRDAGEVATITVGARRGVTLAQEPTEPATRQLVISALNFHFGTNHYEVPAGIAELVLNSGEGSHTLLFADPKFAYLALASPAGALGPSSVKADFVAGETYTVYCVIPGHRAAGMEATITVVP